MNGELYEARERIAALELAVHDLVQRWDHEDGHSVPGPTPERMAEIRRLVGRT